MKRLRLFLASLLLLISIGMVGLVLAGELQFGIPWRDASRASVGIAPRAGEHPAALVQLYAARAFSWRGFFGVHTWIALKPEGADHYTVLEVLGWNLRRNLPVVSITAGDPDRLWYNASPHLLHVLEGEQAARAIPRLLEAARNYPHAHEYRVWPGPNSNTFIAHLIRQTPELNGAELPPTAIGKDYLPGGSLLAATPSHTGLQLSLLGGLGIAAGWEEGVEMNLLGLSLGVDLYPPALKLPVWGRLGFPNQADRELGSKPGNG